MVAGSGGFSPAWWTGDSGSYLIDIRVDQNRWRQGVGTALFDILRSRLVERQATRLLSWVREDAKAGRGFAVGQGFRETGQVIEEYRLHVPDANTAAYKGIEERLRGEGMRFASLAELRTDDATFLRALRRLWNDAAGGSSDSERSGDSLSTWRRNVLEGPGQSAETHWIALEQERPVGTTFLKRLSDDAAENDYTGVAPGQRGRGIAPVLKLHAIAWAQSHGVDWFYTSSELGNAPMLAINRRLGYRPGARRLEISRDLALRV